jgi:phosphatidylserine/phosphatidylglycerophosphate/cardiolipin synthase-like enzyme
MEAIIGSEFPKKVIPLIDSAKQSIKIVVFDWRWYPNDPGNPVQLFNQALVRAVRRGVDVLAISNVADIVGILKNVGIKAKHIFTKNIIHAKMMIIDDETIIIGSHNYTQSAFTMNQEISVIIKGQEDISRFVNFFTNLYG